MPIAAQHIKEALKHLRSVDPIMKKLIKRVGACGLRTKPGHFDTLVSSIISQQISTVAASTIYGRLVDFLKPNKITAESLIHYKPENLRPLGLSGQKSTYILDLAEKIHNKKITLTGLHRLDDQEVIDNLTMVKGIGRWSAQMFLIFSLGRLDVLAEDDLGLQNAVQSIYECDNRPNKKELLKIAEPWAPYRSVASWYLWEEWDNR